MGVEGDPSDIVSNPPQRPANPNPGDQGGNNFMPPEQINAQRLEDWARNFDPDQFGGGGNFNPPGGYG